MKNSVIIAVLLAPSAVCGMKMHQDKLVPRQKVSLSIEKQKERVALNVRQVLTAGKHVYSEHAAIHQDVSERTLQIIKLLSDKDFGHLAQEVDHYSQILAKVVAVYTSSVSQPNKQVLDSLEVAHASCLKWALALGTVSQVNQLEAEVLCAFNKVFSAKRSKALVSARAAYLTRDNFQSGVNLRVMIPVEGAVLAWYLSLPDPKFVVASDSEISSSGSSQSASPCESPGASLKKKPWGLFESFYGDVE